MTELISQDNGRRLLTTAKERILLELYDRPIHTTSSLLAIVIAIGAGIYTVRESIPFVLTSIFAPIFCGYLLTKDLYARRPSPIAPLWSLQFSVVMLAILMVLNLNHIFVYASSIDILSVIPESEKVIEKRDVIKKSIVGATVPSLIYFVFIITSTLNYLLRFRQIRRRIDNLEKRLKAIAKEINKPEDELTVNDAPPDVVSELHALKKETSLR